MKRHLFGTVGSLAVALLMIGCAEDPTASLRGGGVETVVISRTYVEIDVDETVRLNAKAYDAQGNVLPDIPTVTIDDDAIARLYIDTVTSGDPLPQTDFEITGLSDGSIEVTAEAGGVTKTIDVVVFPTLFPGTVTLDASGAVDLITVASSAFVSFDTAATEVLVNDQPTVLLSRTADEIQVAVISAAPLTDAVVTIEDVIFSPPYGEQFALSSLNGEDGVDIRTTLFDGAITVDATKQSDYITIASSSNFSFAANAVVLVDGKPTFLISRSATQLVVAGSNVDAVTAGSITIENALYKDAFDVASIVAATTVNLQAFDNSVLGTSSGAATDLTAGPFPLVVWGLVSESGRSNYAFFAPAADLDLTSSVDWADEDTDIDVYYYDSGRSFVDCLGCGVANPEGGSFTVPAGENYLYRVYLYEGAPTVFRATITSP